jgi:hypothetical protein
MVDRHAGDALQRLGHAAVGELADIVGGDRINDFGSVALDLDCALDRRALPGDDDIGRRGARGVGPGLPGSGGLLIVL